MTDLYETLGVTRDATNDDIRRAFKRKVRKDHPDVAGGDAERFRALVVARDVLADEARRAKYDATGNVDDPPDAFEANALNLVMASVEHVYRACRNRRLDVAGVDVMGDVRKHIDGQLGDVQARQGEARAEAGRLRAFAARFKAKKRGGVNHVARMVASRADEMERNAASADEMIHVMRRAVEIAMSHDYDWKASPHVAAERWVSPRDFEAMINRAGLA